MTSLTIENVHVGREKRGKPEKTRRQNSHNSKKNPTKCSLLLNFSVVALAFQNFIKDVGGTTTGVSDNCLNQFGITDKEFCPIKLAAENCENDDTRFFSINGLNETATMNLLCQSPYYDMNTVSPFNSNTNTGGQLNYQQSCTVHSFNPDNNILRKSFCLIINLHKVELIALSIKDKATCESYGLDYYKPPFPNLVKVDPVENNLDPERFNGTVFSTVDVQGNAFFAQIDTLELLKLGQEGVSYSDSINTCVKTDEEGNYKCSLKTIGNTNYGVTLGTKVQGPALVTNVNGTNAILVSLVNGLGVNAPLPALSHHLVGGNKIILTTLADDNNELYSLTIPGQATSHIITNVQNLNVINVRLCNSDNTWCMEKKIPYDFSLNNNVQIVCWSWRFY